MDLDLVEKSLPARSQSETLLKLIVGKLLQACDATIILLQLFGDFSVPLFFNEIKENFVNLQKV